MHAFQNHGKRQPLVTKEGLTESQSNGVKEPELAKCKSNRILKLNVPIRQTDKRSKDSLKFIDQPPATSEDGKDSHTVGQV